MAYSRVPDAASTNSIPKSPKPSIHETARDRYERRVEYIHRACVQVGGVHEITGVRLSDREPIVHGTAGLIATNASVPLPGRPEIVPSSLAKMKTAFSCSGMTNPVLALKTTPVGAPGTVTVSPSFAPVLPL